DEQALEDRTLLQEPLVLLGRAVTHDVLDAGSVVPAAVEDDDLPLRRQLGDVALEVPLPGLAFRGLGQRGDSHLPRIEGLGDPLDHAALAGGVAALEDDDEALAFHARPLLHLHELCLETQELLLVELAWELRRPVVRHHATETASASSRGSRRDTICETPSPP